MSLTRVYAIILRHFYLTMHHLERFADLLIFPIVGLVMWGFLSNYVKVQSSALASFFLGGMILWVIFERAGSSIGIDFMYELWEKNLVNMLATPLTTVEFIGGLIVVSVMKLLISFGAMAAIAIIFYQFNIFSLGLALVLFWINLMIFAGALGIFSIGLITKWGHSAGPLTWVLPFAIQPFAAVFYPVSVLPKFFQQVVWFLPVSHVFEGMRYTLGTNMFNFGEFTIAFVLNVIYFSLAIAFFTYMLNMSKKKGTLAKL